MGRFLGTGFLLIAALLVCAQAHAQTMYRCGNKYQDRPCDAGQKGKAVGSASFGAPEASTGDAQCAQRGKDSLKITWAREGGATEERMMSEARTSQDRRLVTEVYRRRGSASQVQAAIEADCAAEKQKEAEANALAIAAARARGDLRETRGEPGQPAPSMSPSQPGSDAAAAERGKEERAAQEASAKKATCASLSSQMESLRSRERAGGTVRTMERLSDERRQLQSRMSSNGC